jgi:hypothetical protein
MTTSRRTAQWKWVAALVVAVFVTGASVGVVAQGQGGLPQWVAEILAAIASVQSDTDALQGSINAIAAPSQSKVRMTPPFILRTGVMDCLATNVSSSPRSLRVEMVSFNTGAVITSAVSNTPTPAGRGIGTGVLSSAFTGIAYCRFTVLDADGTRADIRGDLAIGINGLIDDTTRVAISAE